MGHACNKTKVNITTYIWEWPKQFIIKTLHVNVNLLILIIIIKMLSILVSISIVEILVAPEQTANEQLA